MSEVKQWVVSLPIYGSADFSVEADSKEAAIAAAIAGDGHFIEFSDWEISVNACRGNMCGRTQHDHPDAYEDE